VLLAVLADHVVHEGLDVVSGRLVVVLDAADVVADQHDRVLAGVLRQPVELDGEVVLAASLDGRGVLDDGRGGLRGRGHELAAHAHVHDAELTGAAGVGVADGAVHLADDLDHARGPVGGLAALERPDAVGLGGPHVPGGLEQVVGEVVRGARVVGAVHGGDRRGRQGGVRVVRGDGRVVPGGDRAAEDAGDRGRGEVQLVDALEVEDDGDRRDVVRELEDLATDAAVGRLGELLVLQRGVRAGEVDRAGEELLAPAAGADRVVAELHIRVLALEAGLPGLHRGLLAARARADQVAAELRGVAARVGAASGLVGRPAGGQRQGAGERQGQGGGAGLAAELQPSTSHVVARTDSRPFRTYVSGR
jgi:hypothetical protein